MPNTWSTRPCSKVLRCMLDSWLSPSAEIYTYLTTLDGGSSDFDAFAADFAQRDDKIGLL